MNASFQKNRDAPVSYEGQYSTDVLAGKAYAFLDEALAAEKPFFITLAPVAPHSNIKFQEITLNGNIFEYPIAASPPIPAERHKDLFKDAFVPRTPNFNPDKVSHVSSQSQPDQLKALRPVEYLGFLSFLSKTKRTSTLMMSFIATGFELSKQLTRSSKS